MNRPASGTLQRHIADFVGVVILIPVLSLPMASSSALAQTSEGAITLTQEAEFDEQVRQTLLRRPDIILEVFELLEQKQTAEKTAQDTTLIEQYADRLFLDAPEGGPVLVEFLDYRCGYCAKAHSEVLGLRQSHPEVKVITLQFPILGDDSKNMARWMLALKQLHGDAAFDNVQIDIMGGDRLARSDLLAYLETKGFDPQAIAEEAKNPAISAELENVFSLARGLGISGTPGFITRSVIIKGYADEAGLTAAVFDYQP